MKPIENKIMLITYGNTLGKNLTELKDNLKKYINWQYDITWLLAKRQESSNYAAIMLVSIPVQ